MPRNLRGFVRFALPALLLAGPVAAQVTFTTTSLASGDISIPYNQTVAVTGPNAPFTWSVLTGSLPTPLRLNSATGAITGVPNSVNQFDFTIQVVDAVGNVSSQAFTIEIYPQPSINNSAGLATGAVNEAYGVQLTASEGCCTLNPYTFSVPAGQLPPGLSLSGSGLISGAATSAGSFTNINVTVTDQLGGTGTTSFSMTINPALRISSYNVPVAVRTLNYTGGNASVAGGVPPYTWSTAPSNELAGTGLSFGAGLFGNFGGTPVVTGTYGPFSLQVVDANGGTATQLVTLTINPTLSVSTGTSLPAVVQGYPYSFPLTSAGGSGSNSWSFYSGLLPPGIGVSAPGVLGGTTTASAGPYAFRVSVGDSDSEEALSTTLNLTVVPPVTITTTLLPNGAFGDTYSQQVVTSGGSGNFTFSISSGALPTGVTINPTTGLISGLATMPSGFPPNVAEEINVTILVTDAAGGTASQFFGFLMNPTLAVSTTVLPTGVSGSPYSATLATTGGSGTFTWSMASGALPTGTPSLTLNPATGVISGTPTVSGTFTFTALATDSNGGTASSVSLSLYVDTAGKLITTNLLPNMAIVNISGAQDGAAGYSGTNQIYWQQPFDSGGTLLRYTLQPGSYTMRVIDSTDAAALFPNLTTAQLTTIWTSWTYNSPWVTPYLVFDNSAATNASENQLFSGAEGGPGFTGAGATLAAYNWTLANGAYNELFVGARNNPSPVKQLSFPLAGPASTPETLIFGVPDYDLGDNAGGVSVLIAPVASTLVIPGESSISALPNGQAGTAYTPVTLTASGGSGIYVWSNSSTVGPLPAGLRISTAGVISGTPTVMGAFARVLLTVADPVSGAAQGIVYSLQISGPANPLTITTASPLPAGQLNVPYNQTLTASGGLGAYTWIMSPIGAASGLSIAPTTGILSGTITTPGTYSFDVTVADTASDIATVAFSVSALGISTTSLPGGIQGESYSQTLQAAGATGSVTWALTSGALPPGLTLAPSGIIVGVPATVNYAPTAFTLTATDAASHTSSQSLTIQVLKDLQVSFMLVDRDAGLLNISADGADITVLAASAGGYDVARDGSGNFVVAAVNSLLRVTPTGNVSTIATAPSGTTWLAVAIDGAGNIIAGDNGTHAVWRVSPDGTSVLKVANYPVSLPASAEDIKLRVDQHGNYVVAHDNGSTAHVLTMTPGGAVNPVTLSFVPASVGGLAFDHNGNYMLEDYTTGELYQITPSGTTTPFATVSGLGLARNPVSNEYVLAATGILDGVSPNGATVAPLFSGSPLFSAPRGIIAVTSDFISTVDATNPLGYFRLEAANGVSEVNGIPYSFSTTGSTLSSPGAPIGEASNYAALDGASGYVATTLAGNIGASGSIMAWELLAQLPSNGSEPFNYIAGESAVGNDFDLQFDNSNVLRFYTTNGGQNISYTPNLSTLAGQWHMVVATFDTAATPPTRTIYWDGQLVASDNVASIPNKTGTFDIGFTPVFAGRNFDGRLDEVGVWNYALTPGEVYRMFAETSGTFGSPSAPTTISLGPNTTPVNSSSVALTITGQNLANTTSVWFTPVGYPAQTTVLPVTGTPTSTQVTTTIPGSLLMASGSAEIAVAAGSLPSNELPFTIQAAAVSITTSSLPNGMQYQPYSATTTATGGSGNYSWSITAQDSGLNLSIDASGNLTGTPTASNTDPGLSITVMVTDTVTLLTQSQTFTIVVQPGTPSITMGPQPSGTTAYVLNDFGELVGVTNGVSSEINSFSCPACYDMARDGMGNFVVAAGSSIVVLGPSGSTIQTITSPGGSLYDSVAVDSLGNYIVADTGQHQLVKVVPGSGPDSSVTTTIGSWTPPSGTTYEDAFVRIDGGGKYILAVDSFNDSDGETVLPFHLYTSTGGALTPLALTGYTPASTSGLTFDAHGNYVDVDWWNDTILTITPTGASTALFTDPSAYLSYPRGIARDAVSGNFFLTDTDNSALYTLSPDGSQLTQIAVNGEIDSPSAVLLANTIPQNVSYYVLENNENSSIVSVGTGTTFNCEACIGFPGDFAVDPQGNFIVAAAANLVKVTPPSGACPTGCTILTATGTQNFYSVAVDNAGNYWVADNNNHQVLEVTPGSSPTVVATIPYAVNEAEEDSYEDVYVRINSAGQIVLAEDNDDDNPFSVFVFSPTASSAGTPLTLNPTGLLSAVPTTYIGGMTFDASGNIVITDDNNGDIYSATPAGALSVAYNNANGTFSELSGIYFDPISGTFLTTDYDNDALFSVNPAGTPVNAISSNLESPVAVLSVPNTLTVITSALPGGVAGQPYSAIVTAQGGTGNYSWSATGLPGTLAMSTAGVITGTPTAPGTISGIVATVTDLSNGSLTAMKIFSITVAPGTAPVLPAISSLSPPSATAGGPAFTLTVNGGNFVSGSAVEWGSTPLATTFVSATQLMASVSAGLIASPRGILVTVMNPGGATSTAATFTIASTTLPLTITSSAPAATGTVGTPYGPFTLTASGGSGSYLWSASGVPGLSVTSQTPGTLGGTPTVAGSNLTLTVTATDASNPSSSVSQNYPVTIAASPLSITTSSLPGGIQGQPYNALLAGTGGSGSYTWSVSGIAGLRVAAGTNSISGSPTVGGSLTLTVTLSDALNPAATPATRPYTVNIAFAPLSITSSGALGEFAPGAAISTAFNASGGSPGYTWSAPTAPAGINLNSGNGQLTGTAPTQPGNYTFPLKVKDTETPTASDSTTVSFSVLGFTTPLTLPSGSMSTSYSLNFVAAGGTPPYSFSAPSLPGGLTLTSSGFLSGKPAKPGSTSFQVSVSDATAISPVAATFTLTVAAGVQPVQVTGIALPDGTAAASYSQVLEAQDGQPSYMWSVIGGTLPAGLTLSGSGTISGTPTATGPATFTARATDSSGGFAAAVFTIMVDPAPLQLLPALLPNAMAGLPYGAQPIVATGGVPPYTFAITQGSLPSPLTFSSGQVNSGVPGAAGSSSFTVTVTDSSAAGDTASQTFSLLVEPLQPDLVLSQGTVSFAIVGNAVTLPPAAQVTVGSSVASTLGYTVQVAPAALWLDVSPLNATTGSTITIAPDAANAPALAPGNYSTFLTVECLPLSCSGTPHTILVTLNVTAPAPQLTLGSALLSFSATGVGSATPAQPLSVQNTGGGVIHIQSVGSTEPWVSFIPTTIPTTLSAGQVSQLQVIANTAALSVPGYYQSTITLTSDAGSATVPVTLLISPNPTMTLNPAGEQFAALANSSGSIGGSFLVSASGNSPVNWTAAVVPVAPATTLPGWLTLNTASGSSTAANPGSVSFSINPAGLAAQPYYATIQITNGSDTVTDPVQAYQVVLNVTNVAIANPAPQGLVFISAAGGGALPPQTVQVKATSVNVNYSPASGGGSWLSAALPGGNGQARVSVNATGLAPGVYYGGVDYTLLGQVSTVNVTLIVEAGGVGPAISGVSGKATPSCTPSQLIPTQTGLVNNFSLPTAWPTPLEITVNDDCGNAITSGQVVTTFSNGDPPLLLPATGTSTGVYSGTWTPRASASQVTITAQAAAQGFKAASVQITGQVTRNGAPVLNAGGSLNAFIPQLGAPLAPGMIVQIYGSNLASQVTLATSVPLPTTLNNTTVLIGGVMAPLYYVSPGQINAQVPFELTPGGSYQVIVNANGALSTPNAIQVAVDSPGIAAFASGGIIAEHESGTLISDASPAMPGEYIIFFVSGMGPTNNTVASGTASPSSPLATPTDPPTLTLNGVNVPVSFAGLTPTLVGLYQVNFQVPANTPNGDLQLVLTQSGGQSNTTVLAVHN